jgi:hypothetical protein
VEISRQTKILTKNSKLRQKSEIDWLSGEFKFLKNDRPQKNLQGSRFRTEQQDMSSSTTPALPPGLEDLNSVSREEFFKQMERHPLFMHDLDSTSEDNPELEALQALAYEGTPLEIATNFKSQGNEAFHEKRYRDALEFYSKGLAAKSGDAELEGTLLLNRAAVNLELRMSPVIGK